MAEAYGNPANGAEASFWIALKSASVLAYHEEVFNSWMVARPLIGRRAKRVRAGDRVQSHSSGNPLHTTIYLRTLTRQTLHRPPGKMRVFSIITNHLVRGVSATAVSRP
ncbi:hypothetical protein GGP41_004284 [Bipolaris sorokiniana]|uniref:Uncharacterized protein n=1 Tax=Cochliobolus sativus TaxID=45130 RepID=A0A8H6DXI0_COCSA|nr:hypothetical protein GGP41_004284 [Bipolaris sorokiniana]